MLTATTIGASITFHVSVASILTAFNPDNKMSFTVVARFCDFAFHGPGSLTIAVIFLMYWFYNRLCPFQSIRRGIHGGLPSDNQQTLHRNGKNELNLIVPTKKVPKVFFG